MHVQCWWSFKLVRQVNIERKHLGGTLGIVFWVEVSLELFRVVAHRDGN